MKAKVTYYITTNGLLFGPVGDYGAAYLFGNLKVVTKFAKEIATYSPKKEIKIHGMEETGSILIQKKARKK